MMILKNGENNGMEKIGLLTPIPNVSFFHGMLLLFT